MRCGKRVVVVFCALVAAAGPAIAAHPVYISDREGISIPKIGGGKTLTAADVRASIVRGGAELGWVVVQETPASIRLKLDRTKYAIVVDIPFDATTYGLKYVSSDGLRYKENRNGRSIHSTYQRLTNNLMHAIDENLSAAQM